MANLLVYYSRTGLTEKAAMEIARGLGGDTEKISDVKSRSGILGYLRSGKEAMKKMLTAIGAVKYNPSGYNLVVIGTPVWAGNISSPTRTYLTQAKGRIKKYAVFITQGGNGTAQKSLKNIEDLIGSPPAASVVLTSKEVANGLFKEKTNLFIGQIKKLSI